MLTFFETTAVDTSGKHHPVNFPLDAGPGLLPENVVFSEAMRLAKERSIDVAFIDWTWAVKDAEAK
jgi:hypothetical protein